MRILKKMIGSCFLMACTLMNLMAQAPSKLTTSGLGTTPVSCSCPQSDLPGPVWCVGNQDQLQAAIIYANAHDGTTIMITQSFSVDATISLVFTRPVQLISKRSCSTFPAGERPIISGTTDGLRPGFLFTAVCGAESPAANSRLSKIEEATKAVVEPATQPVSCCGGTFGDCFIEGSIVKDIEFRNFQPYALRMVGAKEGLVWGCQSSSAFQFFNCLGMTIQNCGFSIPTLSGTSSIIYPSYNGSGIELDHCENVNLLACTLNRTTSNSVFENFRCGDVAIKALYSDQVIMEQITIGNSFTTTDNTNAINKFEAGIELSRCREVRISDGNVTECYTGLAGKELVGAVVESLNFGANAPLSKDEACRPVFPQAGIWLGPGCNNVVVNKNQVVLNMGHGICLSNPEMDKLCQLVGFQTAPPAVPFCGSFASSQITLTQNMIGSKDRGNRLNGILVSLLDSGYVDIGGYAIDGSESNTISYNGKAGIAIRQQKNVQVRRNLIFSNDQNEGSGFKVKAIALEAMPCVPFTPPAPPPSNPLSGLGKLGNAGMTVPRINAGLWGTINPMAFTYQRTGELSFTLNAQSIPSNYTADVYVGDGPANTRIFIQKLNTGNTSSIAVTLPDVDHHYILIVLQNDYAGPVVTSDPVYLNRHSSAEVYSINLADHCNFVKLSIADNLMCENEVGHIQAIAYGPGPYPAATPIWQSSTDDLNTLTLSFDNPLIASAYNFQVRPISGPISFVVRYPYLSGCSTSPSTSFIAEKAISVWKSPALAGEPVVVPASCATRNDGTITWSLGATGGPSTPPTQGSFLLERLGQSNPVASGQFTDLVNPTHTHSGLSPGTYRLTVTNIPNGCSLVKEITLGVNPVNLAVVESGYASCRSTGIQIVNLGIKPKVKVRMTASYTYFGSAYTYLTPRLVIHLPQTGLVELVSGTTNPQPFYGTFPRQINTFAYELQNGPNTFTFDVTYDLPFDPAFTVETSLEFDECEDQSCETWVGFCSPNSGSSTVFPLALPSPAKPILTLTGTDGGAVPVIYRCKSSEPIFLNLSTSFTLSNETSLWNPAQVNEIVYIRLIGPDGTEMSRFFPVYGDPEDFTSLSDFPSPPLTTPTHTTYTLEVPQLRFDVTNLSSGDYKVQVEYGHFHCIAEQTIQIMDLAPEITFEIRPEMCHGEGGTTGIETQKSRITAHVQNAPPFGVNYVWYKSGNPDVTGAGATMVGNGLELIGQPSATYWLRIEVPQPIPGLPCDRFAAVQCYLPRVELPCSAPQGSFLQKTKEVIQGTTAYVKVCGFKIDFMDDRPRHGVAPDYQVYWYKKNCTTLPPVSISCNTSGLLNPETVPVSGSFGCGPGTPACLPCTTGTTQVWPSVDDCLLKVSPPNVTYVGDDRRVEAEFLWEHFEDSQWYYAVLYDTRSMCHTFLGEAKYIKPRAPRTYNLCLRWGFPEPPPAAEPVPVTLAQGMNPLDLQDQIKDFKAACAGSRTAAQTAFASAYNGDPGNLQDELGITYTEPKGQYTLYYYNRAGNLMQTVPPQGVNTNGQGNHTMTTTYEYNTLGQNLRQNTPDGGTTDMRYNAKGLVRYSRNARQLVKNTFSYTNYDALNRVVLVGQNPGDFPTNMESPVTPDATSGQWVRTTYSDPYRPTGTSNLTYSNVPNGRSQSFTDNRVSFTETHEGTVTAYSYDPHGNVEWVYQFFAGANGMPEHPAEGGIIPRREHWIRYEYDLISGKVLKVALNEHRADRFFHRYQYDEDNRLVQAETSRDGLVWEADAHYEYFAHGPLQRVELGADKVQSVDYAYTLQGWLKGINTTRETQDLFSMKLDYFRGDHSGIPNIEGGTQLNHELFNGNIAAWESQVGSGSTAPAPLRQYFGYDLLNRLKVATADGSDIEFGNVAGAFGSSYSYYGNGNLMTLSRNNEVGGEMDRLTYTYQDGTNRLDRVGETVIGAVGDPDLQPEPSNQQPYGYDETGNLTRDRDGQEITWTAFGKIATATHLPNGGPDLTFAYDAAGNRVMKQARYTSDPTKDYVDWYVRDAAGNTLAIYREKKKAGSTPAEAETRQTEILLYGSDRLGTYAPAPSEEVVSWSSQPSPTTGYANRGRKVYELKDHLGNVRATVGDGLDANGDPVLKSGTDYYPGGMLMPGRNYTSNSYRYGAFGYEKDDETKGSGNSYTTEYRQYDPRLVTWTSPDPLTRKYPSHSPYAFVRNNPIMLIDPTGLGDKPTNKKPVKEDVNKAGSQGKTEGDIKPVAPATPIMNPDGTPNKDAYNCHSYAWENCQGSPSDPENKDMVNAGITKWDQNPENNTQGYKAIPFDAPNQVGDRIIYYSTDANGNVYATHSAIVTGIDKAGNAIEATSKWGQFGVYKHHPRDVPDAYSADAPTATTAGGQTYETRVYYRKVTASDVSTNQQSSNQSTMSLPPIKYEQYVMPANATYVAPPAIPFVPQKK